MGEALPESDLDNKLFWDGTELEAEGLLASASAHNWIVVQPSGTSWAGPATSPHEPSSRQPNNISLRFACESIVLSDRTTSTNI